MSQRGVYRGIYSALPDDPDFQWLSAKARLVLLVARICKQAGPAVIFRYYPAVLSAQTGLTRKEIETALVELQEGKWVEYDENVLWVRNGLRYDPYLNLRNERQRVGVERAVAELPRSQVVLNFCDYYKIVKPFDRVSDSRVTEYRVPSTEVTRVPSTETTSCAADLAAPAREILTWLNQKAGKSFRPVEANLALIRARLKDGVEPFQLKAIVSRKVREWAGTDQATYLRPATLFNKTKCEQYLGELPPASDNGDAD